MSAVPAQSQPAPRRLPGAPRPRLRPAPEPGGRKKPRLGYALVAISGVALIVAAQLLLSLAMTDGAYQADGYETTSIKLTREQQKLSEDLDKRESPQYLARNAESLGMVPNSDPVYLRLSDGAVLGQPRPSGGGAASGALVPNALIDGVPLVTEQQQAQTAAEGAPADPAAPPPPVQADALPTPDTH